MAQTVSQAFKEKIRDGISEQSALVVMKDLFFSASDISNGISISQFFNTSDDLTFGDCPSDTLDFTIIAGGMLAGYSFGEAKVYFGVQTASESYVFGDTNAHIEVDGDIYSAKTGGGLYKNDTLVDSGEYISLVSDGTNIYAIGTTSAVRMIKGSSAVNSYTPNNFMGQKLQTPLSAVFDGSTAYVWDGEHLLTYEYVPMGVYNIERPRSTVGQTVEIQDAHDRMALFDVDASEFLSTLTYPITLSTIYTRLCNYIGVPYVSSTFLYSDTSYSSSPFPDNSFSCRQLLSWIAERARRVAHFNRIGQLDLITYGDTVEESITAQDISQNGFSVAEYDTRRVTGVLLKSSNGASLSYGTMKNPYQIMGNPLINTISSDDLTAYRAIRTYVPMEFEILEADPSIDIGDIVNVQPLVEDYNMLTDSFGVAYAVWQEWFLLYGHDDVVVGNGDTPKVYGKALEGDVAYAVPSPVYPVPLMNREIVFNGFCRAKYTITGNEKRKAELDGDTKYNANATPITQEGVFNRLVGNDLAQGIYLEGGKIYINAEYIKAGTISADMIYGGTLQGVRVIADIGEIGGWSIDSEKLLKTYVKEETILPATATEWRLELTDIFLGLDYPSAEEYLKYDVNGDGALSSLDTAIMSNMELNSRSLYTKHEYTTTFDSVTGRVIVRDDYSASMTSGVYGAHGTKETQILPGAISTGGVVARDGYFTNQVVLNTLVYTTQRQASDERLKHDIQPITKEAVDALSELHPSTFILNHDKTNHKRYGLIAQDVEPTVLSDVVSNINGYLSLNYTDLIAVLIAGWQAHEERLRRLEE